MKVLHTPYCYYPDPVGGTEVYVQALAYSLRQKTGIESIVAAPLSYPPVKESAYWYNGFKVRRFAVSNEKNTGALTEELYGKGNAAAAYQFGNILDDERPDIFHLHAFSRGCSVLLVREAKARGIPVVFTYHTPTVSCQRATLMRWGKEACNGVLDLTTCTSCTLNSLGLNELTSNLVGRLPPAVGRGLRLMQLSGGPWTALRMSQLIEMRLAATRALLNEVDMVVALCHWTERLLLDNGLSGQKIVFCQHGHNGQPSTHSIRQRRASKKVLRLAYLGRLHPTKGIDLVIRALKQSPDLPVELDIYGVIQGAPQNEYIGMVQNLIASDARITLKQAVPTDEVISVLTDYDLLVVPSRGFETGPLVVLEAFAAHLPVIGSNLGGISELIKPNENGLLVEPESIGAWEQALRRCIDTDDLLEQLRAGIPQPKTMSQVALEMKQLYQSLLQNKWDSNAVNSSRSWN